jgi:hypothetical protein
LNLECFYFFSGTFHPGALFVEPTDEEFDAQRIVRGKIDPPSPCLFKRNTGKRPLDVIGSGFACLELLSSRALEVLRIGEFTGWRSFPVEIQIKKDERLEGYEGLVITGRCGPIDWSKGKHIRNPPRVPQGCSYDTWIGAFFDLDTWDKSDLFFPEGTTMPIVTEPVKLAFEVAMITNVKFTRLTEFDRSWPI